MNSRNITAIKDINGICFKCLKRHSQENIHKIHIPSAGYGSCFDNLSTDLQLCDSCYADTDSEWWKFETMSFCESGGTVFKYDDDIRHYLNNLPLQGQELVWNRFAYGACADFKMGSQDWIDFELGELPHDNCKEYGIYSPDEKKAYEERFPTCQYPINKVFDDYSISCWCPFGAFGAEDQHSIEDISEECYNCKNYKKRETPIISVDENDWDNLVTYVEYQINKSYLEEKFGKLELGI